jgi:ribosome-associated heat shock protein Hsp15
MQRPAMRLAGVVMASDLPRVRLDKWLWAARFFKTRSLASQGVEGGKVKVNGERAKPSKEVKPGDQLLIHLGEYEWQVTVLGLANKRGPAEQARQLYEETEASQQRRAEQVANRRLQVSPAAGFKGRPTKRDRRLIHRFTDG